MSEMNKNYCKKLGEREKNEIINIFPNDQLSVSNLISAGTNVNEVNKI